MDDPQLPVPATPAVVPEPSGKFDRWVKVAPFIIALATAVFYLNGRAYHQGYLQHFGLLTSMFDDDLANGISYSVRAWVELTVRTSTWATGTLKRHWDIALWSAPAIYLGLLVVHWLWVGLALVAARAVPVAKRASAYARDRVPNSVKTGCTSVMHFLKKALTPPAWARKALAYVWLGYLSAYVGYLAATLLALVLLVLITPFDWIGDTVAAEDQRNNFVDFPVIQLKAENGRAYMYRLILCAPQYCAVSDGTAVVAIPQTQMVWATATPPKLVPKTPK